MVLTSLTAGFVQWLRIASDDRGGFRFVPAFWSEALRPAQVMVPDAGRANTPGAPPG
jgi:hypothetical protein